MKFNLKVDMKFSITNCLLIIYVLVFICQSIFGRDYAIMQYALNTNAVLMRHEYWRIITGAFMHGDIWHLFMNCYFIFYLGNGIEDMLGKGRYLALFFITILTSSGAIIAWDYFQMTSTFTVGASGFGYGLIGLLAGFAIIYPNRYYKRYLYGLIANIALYSVIFFVFAVNISWSGHFGGLIGGLITALIMNAFFKKEQW